MVEMAAAHAPLVLSLDIGSSSVRASAYDARGRRLSDSAAQVTYRLDTTADGGVEIDPDALLERVCAAVDAALHRLGDRARDLAAVATSVFVSSVMGVDAGGRPVTPLYTYADTRNAQASAELRRVWDAAAVYDRTGCPIHASYLPSRLHWLRRATPDAFAAAARWVSFGEFMFEQIFGRPGGLGLSVAAWTGLLNRRTLTWDGATLELLALAPAALGELDIDGRPLTDPADAWGQRWPALRSVPWYPPLGDGLCSNLGTSPAAGGVVINLGTSAAARAIVPGPQASIPAGLWEYRVSADRSLLGGALSNGGNVAVWMRETLAGVPDATFDDAVGALPPDGHGLTVLPFFAGERSPGWNDAARATVHGLRLHTRSVDIARAAIEAVAYRLGAIYDLLAPALAEGHPVTVSGGGFRASNTWTQIMADVLGRELHRSNALEATSRGAARWVMRALAGPESDASNETAPVEAFQPDSAAHAVYQSARRRQQDLYERVSGTELLDT